MKQLLQSLKDGTTTVAEVPAPGVRKGELLIATRHSLISAGTERMLVDFGKAGLIGKARQQPDKVRMALEKMRTDGVVATVDAIRHKLDQPVPLGYCNVGEVIGVGAGVHGFSMSDLVVSNGKHAEVVSVPKNLCAKIPAGVSPEDATFAVLGAIGLQGIRLAEPTIGETVVVTGLGLIGLLTVQLLRANGCRVLGADYDANRLALARQFGAETVDLSSNEDPVKAAEAFTRGRGADAVLITASTSSNEPVSQAARMCRKRGRIVLVGVSGLELSRADFYEKELSFQVSCSYGPGRYDPGYEDEGNDYPLGFVRWTEQRNFEAVLDLMASSNMKVGDLVSHRFKIDDAEDAYQLVSGGSGSLGVVLDYPSSEAAALRTSQISDAEATRGSAVRPGDFSQPRIGFIGAGNYASAVLIPAFAKSSCQLSAVCTENGVSGNHIARKFGIPVMTTSTIELIESEDIDAVVVATRHDSHGELALRALAAGKHVFVEKPLTLSLDELSDIEDELGVQSNSAPSLMVGFNRRFAPQVRMIKDALATVREPMSLILTMNAGPIDEAHWTQHPEIGGGRIVGEACHFIDLARYLIGDRVDSWSASAADTPTRDTASITLKFANGSIATVHYFSNGHKSMPKERIEVFAGGQVLRLDNFRELHSFGWNGVTSKKNWRQNKGQSACVAAFIDSIRGSERAIPAAEILEVSRLSIEIAAALR